MDIARTVDSLSVKEKSLSYFFTLANMFSIGENYREVAGVYKMDVLSENCIIFMIRSFLCACRLSITTNRCLAGYLSLITVTKEEK